MVIWMEHCNSDALKEARLSEGAFLVIDNRVLNGPLGRSICSFTRTPHSAHSICSARRAFHGVASSAAARNDMGASRKIEEEKEKEKKRKRRRRKRYSEEDRKNNQEQRL